ncbi:MAG: heme o synthase [Gemmatimonadota bacterium]|nr:heme o synthase [Gemmatimonadota bacterium]
MPDGDSTSSDPGVIRPIPGRPARTGPGAFYELTKPGITGYVMITAGAGAYVATHGQLPMATAIHTMVGTGLATGGALALNQYVEREVDAVMVRTRVRPIPSGRVDALHALAFGGAMLWLGLTYLILLVGWLPAALVALSGAIYHGVYTPLKTRSYLATLSGAVPGALPALIGWGAATGRIEAGGVALFAIAYLWQLPHVMGLGWMLREDYARVGFKLLPRPEGDGRVVARHMVAYAALLVPASALPSILGYTGPVFLVGALAASTAFLGVCVRALPAVNDRSARRVFFSSLLYHPVLLVFILLDTLPG